MKIEFRRRLGMLGLAASMYCTACGNSPPAVDVGATEAVPAGNLFVGQKPVYAYLDSGSGGSWIFTTITESDLQPGSGYLVRLNDLAPAFDTRLAECTPQAYPLNHKCSPTHPFREKAVGVIGKIISGGIAAGTAGKVTDFSRNYKTSFDEAEFNQAVDEALINTGLNSERQQLLTTLERYETLQSKGRRELEALSRHANSTYRDTNAIAVTVQPTLNGLLPYYTRDIDFRSLVEIVPRVDSSQAPATLNAKPLLPCDARSCVTTARNALASLETDLASAKAAILAADARDSTTYDIRCDATTWNGYSLTLECPEQARLDASGAMVVPLTVNILSRDFEGLYPDFVLADERMRVTISGSTVNFSNLTNNYVAVMAETVYYNSQVQTAASRINLAPGVSVSHPMKDFVSPAIGIESSFRQMTPDKAAAASFRFGFATKYRVAGQADEFTLYDVRTFNVGCTISNRIEFGSCSETVAATREIPEASPLYKNEAATDTSDADEKETADTALPEVKQ
jgi:hypothetical protein